MVLTIERAVGRTEMQKRICIFPSLLLSIVLMSPCVISTFEGVTVLALPHKRPSAAPPPALVLHRGALRLVLVDGVEGVAVTGVLQ